MGNNTITATDQATAVTTSEPASLMSGIVKAASDPNTDVEKMERLWQMYERIESRNAEAEFNKSLNRCQNQMGRISADANNPQTRSKYATYAQLDRVLRPIYTREGFSLSFDTGDAPQESYVRVLCYVSHESGFTRTYRADMPADGKGAKGNDVMTKTHAAGSAMSYGSRYLLKLIFNVAVGEDDDDGNSASQTVPPITENQVSRIYDMMEAGGVTDAQILRAVHGGKVPEGASIRSIPSTMHDKVVSRLQANINSKQEQSNADR